uniref:Uncharacterized protein n=1 Tax=Meloidogyne enterolobii TaxID=390850 RepID=A0A6V7UJ82_MELEN|nr:unnamed protein product [Meloidogyne enterolobii]
MSRYEKMSKFALTTTLDSPPRWLLLVFQALITRLSFVRAFE